MQTSTQSAPIKTSESQKSLLHFYSLGVAANNKEIGQNELMVTPIEALTLIDGELGSIPFEQKASGLDAAGEAYQTSVQTDMAIPCTWFPMANSNRRTSPDVRRGERVVIYRFADRNEYMWQSLGLDDHLRKLETVVFSISGTADEEVDGTEAENAYFIEASSHRGTLTIQTSMVNDEKTSWAFQMDGKNGRLTVSDHLGNNMHINSVDTIVELENADNTLVRLDKKTILMEAAESITAKTKVYNIETETMNINASSAINTKTSQHTLEASQLTVNAASTFTKAMQATGITSPVSICGPLGCV